MTNTRRELPVMTKDVKEIMTKDKLFRIRLWQAVYSSNHTYVVVYIVDLFKNGKLADRHLYSHSTEANDKYYDLMQEN